MKEAGENRGARGVIPRFITKVIDLFYFPIFQKTIPIQTFRYVACGGAGMVLGWVLYFLTYNFFIAKRYIDLGFVVISPHIATMVIISPIVFLVGYYLNKYVTFTRSQMSGGVQAIRYALSFAGSFVLNYALLKLFVEGFGLYPTPSQMITSIIIALYSYLMQKYFSFKEPSSIKK